MFLRLDQQSWTRQDTKLTRDLASFQRWFNTWSSRTMTFSAGSIFRRRAADDGLTLPQPELTRKSNTMNSQ